MFQQIKREKGLQWFANGIYEKHWGTQSIVGRCRSKRGKIASKFVFKIEQRPD